MRCVLRWLPFYQSFSFRSTLRVVHLFFLPRICLCLGIIGSTGFGFIPSVLASTEEPSVIEQSWSFSGPFGTYDKAQLQRGLKVYREVCAACHGLSLVTFRSLAEEGALGLSEAQVKALAAEYLIQDGPDGKGEMFERPGKPFDRFPSPFPNDEAAKAANNGAAPPDLSLIAKARAVHRGFPRFLIDALTLYQESGPDYLVALLTGYAPPPEGMQLAPGMSYNPNFIAGSQIAMPPPLSEGLVSYTDGTPETLENYAKDVAAFLMWSAEPKLEERKKIGLRVVVFLLVFAGMLYFVNKKIWAKVKQKQ